MRAARSLKMGSRTRRAARRCAAAVLALALALPALATAGQWSALVLIYPETDVTYAHPQLGPVRIQAQMTGAEVTRLRDVAHDFARLTSAWSRGRASIALNVRVAQSPLRSVTLVFADDAATADYDPGFWVERDDAKAELAPLLAQGDYDSVFVLWHSGEPSTGNPLLHVPTRGYQGVSWNAPVAFKNQQITWSTAYLRSGLFDASVTRDPGEGLLHEWLHPVPGFYRARGYDVGDSDEALLFGHTDANGDQVVGGFEAFYRELMRGRLIENPADPVYAGISDAVWASGSIRASTRVVPDPPQLLAPIDGSCATSTPTLLWQGPLPSGVSYEVRLRVPGSLQTITVTPSPPALSLVLPGGLLQEGELYEWEVAAVSASGESLGDRLQFLASVQASIPSIIPSGGALVLGAPVQVSSPDPSGVIRYTTDGSDPTTLSAEVPGSGRLFLSPPVELRTRAFGAPGSGCGSSPVVSATFELPSEIVVDTTDDSGPGSLRQAILDANATPGIRELVRFQIPGAPPHVIAPESPLPALDDPLAIDGTTQPGFAGDPPIVLDGSSTAGSGLVISGGGSILRGLVVQSFAAHGIELLGAGSSAIQGCFVGTSSDGMASSGNGASGVFVTTAANLIGGDRPEDTNLISGNGHHGVELSGEGATGNQVLGNLIGTDRTAGVALPNARGGVVLFDAPGNRIGGPTLEAGNLISGNGMPGFGGDGIAIAGSTATGNIVQSNFIGTDPSGALELGNLRAGVNISTIVGVQSAAGQTRIGGPGPEEGNLISGNEGPGISLAGSLMGGGGNIVEGNLIGTDASGSAALGNGEDGIRITRDLPANPTAGGNRIGGALPGAGNLISANARDGIGVIGAGASGNVIQGNRIGTDWSGTAPLGNGRSGVRLGTAGTGCEFTDSAADNVVGGETATEGNLISANTAAGVALLGNQTEGAGNLVSGNWIGLDASGSLALGNGEAGVHLQPSACGETLGANQIGGPGSSGNTIGGNAGPGVWIEGAAISETDVLGNRIGIAEAGFAVPNLGPGVRIEATGNRIGSTGAANTIAGNTGEGILILSGEQNELRSNAVDLNGGLGIDLAGGNAALPAPALAQAVVSQGTAASGTLAASPELDYLVELFASPECDPSGSGEGARPLGSILVTTDETGQAPFLWTGGEPVEMGQVLTATATGPAGNTSEFSVCSTAGSGPPEDPDGDGALLDNCPFVPNPDQVDAGALDSAIPDGIGDDCQCGEVSGDGVVDAADLGDYRNSLSGAGVLFTGGAAARCSVFGVEPGVCDLVDLVVLTRALAGLGPGIALACMATGL